MNRSLYQGLFLGLMASVLWGLNPIFFKQMDAFTALEVVAHRTIWTMLVMLVFVYFMGLLGALRRAFSTPKKLLSIAASGVLISCNWLTFVYAIETDQIVEASLGYYIYPMMVVAVGVFGLGERLTFKEWLAVMLAFIGVMLKTYEGGGLPLIALIVSVSFTLYTLLGKTREDGPIVGLLAEATVIAPVALIFLGVLAVQGSGQFIAGGGVNTGLAIATGVVTALPLVMYIASSRSVGMAIAGLMFYLVPSLQLLIGVGLYGEPFAYLDAVAFGFIWVSLGVLALPRKG